MQNDFSTRVVQLILEVLRKSLRAAVFIFVGAVVGYSVGMVEWLVATVFVNSVMPKFGLVGYRLSEDEYFIIICIALVVAIGVAAKFARPGNATDIWFLDHIDSKRNQFEQWVRISASSKFAKNVALLCLGLAVALGAMLYFQRPHTYEACLDKYVAKARTNQIALMMRESCRRRFGGDLDPETNGRRISRPTELRGGAD
ncbi:hypothetical protein E4T66_13685 [Sinimarinibacterium sp. CAU 1509]|uniref:hypothetical protein n=1 Tax=Sinimarinibacterium sp. CAU 1509 TaxID=2562283 RepID=UPI0010AB92ED|nr:hypothetical protein [Sinimarinibacterium sp. CAU 1509]TJY59435.1 hypothetical protein E4T66_13685 [Sinimarinibacterium sp. CAU 1509]